MVLRATSDDTNGSQMIGTQDIAVSRDHLLPGFDEQPRPGIRAVDISADQQRTTLPHWAFHLGSPRTIQGRVD